MDQGQLLSDDAAKEPGNSSASINRTAKFHRKECDFMGSSPIHNKLLIGPILFLCCTNSQSCSELISELAMHYPEDTFSLHIFLYSGSYILFSPPSIMFLEPWRMLDVPFRPNTPPPLSLVPQLVTSFSTNCYSPQS